jgi:diguanylate cyclase (GGDEF)-like protein/PAS domain S-box-containing protein
MVYEPLFCISFLISLLLIAILFRVRKNAVARLLIVMAGLDSLWIFLEGLPFCLIDIKIGALTQVIKFLPVILIPPVFLLATIEYTKFNKKNLPIAPLIFALPALSLLSVISNRFPYPFFSNIQFMYIDGIPIFAPTREIGFWIHTYISYALILSGLSALMIYAFKSARLYRRQAFVIFTGTFISIAINFVVISLGFMSAVVDTTSISILMTLIVFYCGLFRLPKSTIKPFARDLLIESINDIVLILDVSGGIVDLNPAAMRFLKTFAKNGGHYQFAHRADFTGVNMKEALELFPAMETVHPSADEANDSTLILHAGGKAVYFRVYESPIRDTDQAQIGQLYMLHDITQQQEYLNNLKHLNEELALSDRIINDALEGVVITDHTPAIKRVNDSVERISGYSKGELIGRNPSIFKSGRHDEKYYADMWRNLTEKGYWEGEIWNKSKDGEIYPNWMSITALRQTNGKVENYICISTDISKVKKTEDALENLAYYDTLTGLPNRNLFNERLSWALTRAKRNEKTVALLFLDLDNFKVINDSLGHAVGDLMLKEAAHRIKSRLRESDTAARFGGDDFTVILEDLQNGEDAKCVIEDLLKEIRRPYVILDREMTLGMSIGVALAPDDESTVDGLVRKAEAAMYAAKDAGGSTYSFSSEEIEKKNHETLEMQILMSKALVNNEFRLHLQPQIALVDGQYKVVGAEALIRWTTGDGIVFTPDKFIPLAERNGMIIPIGDWVLEEIFSIDKDLKAAGIELDLAINVSSKQFDSGDFVEKVKKLITDHRAQNIRLVIEITESFLLNNLDNAIECLLALKDLGIRVALDDFGTGFSSLSYLSRLPIDYLKIDKTFIADIDSPQQKNLTSSIISMAKIMNLRTVAEGVETREQLDKLMVEGCNEIQGYYFSRPLDVAAFIQYVAQKPE